MSVHCFCLVCLLIFATHLSLHALWIAAHIASHEGKKTDGVTEWPVCQLYSHGLFLGACDFCWFTS